jgi:hypothetical protein
VTARVLALAALLLSLAASPALAQTRTAAPSGPRYWKGNTHTHTLNSDGDASPGQVSHWYRDHGYDFLCLSDHNYWTSVAELQREFDREDLRDAKIDRFLLVPGEEVTDGVPGAPVHLIGLDTSRVVGKQGGKDKHEVLQRSIDAILAAGGVPSVNHPNYHWAIDAEDLAALKGLRHFEIFNGHPGTNSFGGGGSPSCEETWDALLTSGHRMLGVAVDDAHNYFTWGPRECNPGRGWIMVRASELTVPAIRAAYEAGDYYCSTGVTLSLVTCTAGTVRVAVESEKGERMKYTTFYVGAGGKVLARETALSSSYVMRPEDEYVRVRVVSSVNEYAWTQPFFARPEPEKK